MFNKKLTKLVHDNFNSLNSKIIDLRKSFQSQTDSSCDRLNKIEDRLISIEKELGIYDEPKFGEAGYFFSYPTFMGKQNTKPTLKNRIIAIEKHLGGEVKEVKTEEIKLVKSKKHGKK